MLMHRIEECHDKTIKAKDSPHIIPDHVLVFGSQLLHELHYLQQHLMSMLIRCSPLPTGQSLVADQISMLLWLHGLEWKHDSLQLHSKGWCFPAAACGQHIMVACFRLMYGIACMAAASNQVVNICKMLP